MEISKEKKALAVKLARESQLEYGLNCCESVINGLIRAGILEIPEDYTRLATFLSGGCGSSGNTCGALSGAMMALGAEYGRRIPISETPKVADMPVPATLSENPRYYSLRRPNALVQEFVSNMGTCRCRDVIDGYGGYQSEDRKARCRELVAYATELAVKYLSMPQEEANILPFGENIYDWQ